MTWNDLVCAQCAAPVAQGRCATCRATRERMNRGPLPGLQIAFAVVLGLVVLGILALSLEWAGALG